MHFGPIPLAEAEGAILAHSLAVGRARIRKGRRLDAEDIRALAEAGIDQVVAARLDPDDLGEDEAAARLGAALAPDPATLGLVRAAPFTGRLNLLAAAPGILRVDRAAVDAFNAVESAITLATLPDWARVERRTMVATIKIIPFGVPRAMVARACAQLAAPPIRVHPFRPFRAGLILTRLPGMKPKLIDKGAEAIATRILALGGSVETPRVVPHEAEAVAAAIRTTEGDPLLILTASATSDPADTGPAALVLAGGQLLRVGMPVDPGNLLFLGTHEDRTVVGLPGSVRSPALSGADWVLERLAAGIAVTPGDIARMGVGGLLKEIPTRPQPRAGRTAPVSRPRVEALILAAGASRRMAGRDKLLEPIEGEAVLARTARAALASRAERVIVILPPGAKARRAALAGLPVAIVEAPAAAEGMAGSLRTGITAISDRADAVVLMFADMPEVTETHVDRLVDAFDPVAGKEICRALDTEGRPGHPVLFGRRFFESLASLEGDRGARDILREAAEHLVDVPTPGRAATLDLDTPEAWEAWRAGR